MLRNLFKALADFSLCEKRPLLWLLLSSCLFLFSFLLLLPYYSYVGFFLPLFFFCSFLALAFWQKKGLFLAVAGFALFFSIDFFLHTDPFFLWRTLWGGNLCLTLLLFFFSFQEVLLHYRRERETAAKESSTLKHLLCEVEEREASSLHLFDKEREKQRLELGSLQDKIDTLTLLVETSQHEAAKALAQQEALLMDSLSFHKRVAIFELKIAKQQEKIEKLEVLHQEAKQVARQRVHQLNDARVNVFQYQQLVEILQERLKKARLTFLNLRQKELVEKRTIPPQEIRGEDSLLHILEKQKSTHKLAYESARREYQVLKERIEKARFKLQKTKEQEKVIALEREIETLQVELFEKKTEAERGKLELVNVEREIFSLKKEQREQIAAR